jgi:CheY-like chemotaxis protein/HPt (histidine-containing phosphotransfer) domain-containing protein
MSDGGGAKDNTIEPQMITKHSLRAPLTSGRQNKIIAATAKARILVAEDNVINRAVALAQLESLNYFAEVICNGREAVKALENNTYDIVLMDCQMPEMDGFEATAEIRRREGSSKNTTIIALTAHALEGEREKCLAAGMDDYISKPVKLDVLRQVLEKWIMPDEKNRDEICAHAQNVCASPKILASLDTSVLIGLGALQQSGEPDFVTELINLFLTDASQQIERLENAGQADTIKQLAHTLKGSSGNLGVCRLAALSDQLEEEAADVDQARALITEIKSEFENVRRVLKPMRKND